MSEETIVLVARLKVRTEAVEEMKDLALGIVEDSRNEAGCINYDVHQALDDPTVFVWHETWTGKAALDAHFEEPHFKQFFARGMELAAEEPQITITKMISEK